MTRRRFTTLLVIVTAAAATIGGTVLAARQGHDRRDDERRAAAAATPGSSAPPVRVVLPGRPGEAATITDSDAVRAPDGSTYNAVDTAFVQMMIVHHGQALRMAGLGVDRAGDARVRALAGRINAAQGPEIERMRAWLTQRRLPPTDPRHDHATMPGMQSEADVLALAALRGPAFDRRFVAMMSAHHLGAVQMAGDVLAAGSDQTISELANELAVEQRSEISRMDQLGLG